MKRIPEQEQQSTVQLEDDVLEQMTGGYTAPLPHRQSPAYTGSRAFYKILSALQRRHIKRLAPDQLRKKAFGGDQLVISAVLHNLSPVKHQDAVALADRGKTVGYHNAGASQLTCLLYTSDAADE